jgi:dihydrofolate reductase
LISLVVAMDKERAIGVDNKLPWHLPADLKRFKQLTLGHHIIMGRKTFESIGKPLPGRTNVIVTRQRDYKAEGCKVVHSLDAAVMLTREDEQAFIIGGADLFEQAMKFADRLYITEIDTRVERGDTFFPKFDKAEWNVIEKTTHEPDDKNRFRYVFLTYQRQL